ncbi:hypothetical protein RHODGE_RHODGE_03323 [Rhodoplanes serenus]|uniref:Uncharacterized protein n=1 Tax=Rhodoplanes serenus TaxID=200615 RepID=A0A447CXX3_9BRAD|nr:hypothetical protein [Rhodoplanes serenus]VCU10137.1 hypothetical protein RHODGE_RHODGE_03323 [Rhodoplanes serenus]
MTAIPFPLSTSPGANPQDSAGRLINTFAEPLGRGARSVARWRRAPGLTLFGSTARTGCRGMHEINGILYSAWNGRLVKHTAAGGAAADIGALNGAARVFFFRNNKTPTPDQFVVDPNEGAFIFTPTTVSAYPDVDLPAVNSGCAFDGYGIFSTGAGLIYATDLNSTAVSALSFARAEANPDGLLRVIPWGSRLLAFGARTIETWTNAGTSPFPLARDVVIPRGLAGRYAVAGHEDGFTRALLFVGDDLAVYRLDGYTPVKVSPPDLDALIEDVPDKDTLEACVYVADGHGFWQISSPAWTWVFNTNSETWHERRSHLGSRSRITTSHNAFGRWLVGDTQSGNILAIDPDVCTEAGNPFPMLLESGPVTAFPGRVRVARADFDMTTGVGIAAGLDPIETDPTVEIAWSDDGGLSWSAPLRRSLGRQAVTEPVTVRRTGITSTKGRRWRLQVADPVQTALYGGDMAAEARR